MPGLGQALRVPDGDIILDGVGVDHADSLQRAGLAAVVRLAALVLAVGDPGRVDHQGLPVPEADGVASP